jgi:SAM-dependent methyltransferase
VAEPDRLLERMPSSPTSPDSADCQPYWARIWESSLVLAEAVWQADLRDRDVLDLGCGLGLVGAVAAARGARVMLADAVSSALLFARLNTWAWRDRVRTRRLDWRRDRLTLPRFHFILGADILYDREDWPYLEVFWREHLREEGEVWLSEPHRVGSESFVAWIESRGWRLARTTSAPARLPHPPRPPRLLRMCPMSSHPEGCRWESLSPGLRPPRSV